ncbi:actin-related protein, putative [Plasmodium knowlesi strain H]|uniref:Actin-related protein, putative n=3 Tax=Plasmodium knowlesi TaxID=5850 RepID=A0A5K1UEK9_PLAKH|nr:actin-related protein, putative [Plasmodium knowlesi strain H]OTN67808.1 putative Actin [Plasmodium knowlesi]CAA9990383.1 actin-related protein, putative [Plasmodium knowlesi strain H]SBO19589.1 actin-related protein, putative [Plasmodium knowlesi strain H]SBO22648.1 actin-related protein, putative [Plasmodium knowlesi strain H]VVS79857.1 actin-related protein, putative [Plasmodium knowlesi strain H]|eukprot:XP_002260783.1 actin, putative [Plasmodium knowlesi strain H]
MNSKNDVAESLLCGGEDISALVVDMGFSTTKIGHNQEDTPRVFLRSTCGEDVSPEGNTTPPGQAGINGAVNGSVLDDRYPKLKFPLNLNNPKEHIRIKPLFEKNPVDNTTHLNCDVFEKILHYGIEGVESKRVFECTDEIVDPIRLGGLNLKMNEHPILLSEANIHNHKMRAQMTEILFETFNIPALYFAKKAKLSAFSLGRCSALVVDIGASSLNITPVYEGYVLQKNSFEFNIGGDYFDRLIYGLLKKEQVKVVPYYQQSLKWRAGVASSSGNSWGNGATYLNNVHTSYEEEAILDVIRYMKESICKVRVGQNGTTNKKNESAIGNPKNGKEVESPGQTNNGAKNVNAPKWKTEQEEEEEEFFELPDGVKIKTDKYRYDIAEELFRALPSDHNFNGLPDAIVKCIISSDVDIRKELLQAIIVTGGSSLFPGLIDRLYNSLREKECFSQTIKMKILNMSSSVESLYSSWLGGSILSSLGTFQQVWVSRKEYEEDGHAIVLDRCF